MNRSETLVILYLIANIMVVDLGYFSRYLNDLDALCAPVCGRAPPNIPLGNAKTLADSAAYLRNIYKKHCRCAGLSCCVLPFPNTAATNDSMWTRSCEEDWKGECGEQFGHRPAEVS